MEKINWRQDEITLYGKTHAIPRLHAWYGDPEADYSYSRIPLPRNDWFFELRDLKEKVEKKTGFRFNSVLANLYREGSDSNGWHSDNEKELVAPVTVASISLGAPRDFQFRRVGQTKCEETLLLEHGSLLLMKSPCQELWQHQVPKRKKVSGPRLNLTFRLVGLGQ